MELPTIGAHCALSTCNVNDFLPIRCRCESLFCKEHISPETHSCPLLQTSSGSANTATTSGKQLQRCAADKCNKPSLEAFVSDQSSAEGRTPAVCSRCKQSFCAIHREPASHPCTEPDLSQSGPRSEAARALLERIKARNAAKAAASSSAGSSGGKSTTTVNPKKAAQLRQVEVMKMRHQAQPADPKDKNRQVPMTERLHVKVRLKDNEKQHVYWFQKTMGTGKAIDILASLLGMSSDIDPLYLCKLPPDGDGEDVGLQNDKLLADQIEDGSPLLLRH